MFTSIPLARESHDRTHYRWWGGQISCLLWEEPGRGLMSRYFCLLSVCPRPRGKETQPDGGRQLRALPTCRGQDVVATESIRCHHPLRTRGDIGLEVGQQGLTPWGLDLEYKDQNKTQTPAQKHTNWSLFTSGEMTQMCPVSFCTNDMSPLPP